MDDFLLGFPGGATGKELPAKSGDVKDVILIPGSERSSGGGHGNPLQYSCLQNPMGRGTVGYGPQGRKGSHTTEATAHKHNL